MADLAACGIVVGHATDDAGGTGLTVIRAPAGTLRAGVAVLGRATGTRELALLAPDALVDRIDGILLTGGSAYGLDAAAGVMRWMEEQGRGFPVGPGVVPIVPAAVIFDLVPIGRFDARPTADMAYRACAQATASPAEGSVGAGTGATVGKAAGPSGFMKGGVGVATRGAADLTVGAVAVVNAYGDVRDAAGRVLAGARGEAGEFVDAVGTIARGEALDRYAAADGARNTTICVVSVSQPCARGELHAIARASCAALARRITPAGTVFDGDIVFAVSPAGAAGEMSPADTLRIQVLAVGALEDAIERAVRLAKGRDGVPGLADR